MGASLLELVSGARSFIWQHARVKAGESVLVIADTRVLEEVLQAYQIAIDALGATPYLVTIPFVERKGEEGEHDDLPPVARHAMYKADVALFITTEFYHPANRSIVTANCEYGTRVVTPSPFEPEILASEYCRFPLEVIQAISDQQNEILRKGKIYRLTCGKGSDFKAVINNKGHFASIGLTPLVGSRYTPVGYPGANYCPAGCLSVPRVKGAVPGAEGILYMDEIEGWPGGLSEPVRWTIEQRGGYSWVVQIDGGPEARWQWEMISKIPNGNLFSEVMWGLHPQVGIRSNVHYLYGRHCAGIDPTRQSGVIHFAMGSPPSRTEGYKEVSAPIHTHGHMFKPTIYIDDTPIIIDGHVLALDDPGIRRLASKYGDPDELLKEKP